MRRILILLILVGVGYWFVSNKDDIQALVSGKSRFSDEKPQAEIQPVISESRELAAGFQPILRPTAANFYVPTAHASIILDAESGDVLYEQNAHEKRQIASLTKLFTATIAMERIKDLDKPITIDEYSVYVPGTRIGCPRSGFCNGERLKPGEQVRARDLLKAALMNSANDAATVLGIHMGGSEEGFAAIMNARAKELGLENSHFCTPSGLEPDGREQECYSSAYDIAKITAEALKHKELWDMMRVEKEIIYSVDGKYSHEIFNTDQLLGQLPNLIGAKTGFTPMAGYSLLAVTSDYQRNHEVVAVVLDDQYRWDSIRSMFDWSFQSYDWQ